ncbi:hypothetical protein RRG08_023796 [Elysia crispata]|uniref:Uncharacterized protein n=1 Tax=Elysia crispata TaxID=231223 RepID=A0AAE1DMW2_9GAST|nr:hypothetical protein RRG08_023796 [Elysia crispata]
MAPLSSLECTKIGAGSTSQRGEVSWPREPSNPGVFSQYQRYRWVQSLELESFKEQSLGQRLIPYRKKQGNLCIALNSKLDDTEFCCQSDRPVAGDTSVPTPRAALSWVASIGGQVEHFEYPRAMLQSENIGSAIAR